MRRTTMPVVLFAAVFMFTAAFADAGADYKKKIAGTWTFDQGKSSNILATYNADGTYSMIAGKTTMNGKYSIKGKKLTIVVNRKSTIFTIQTLDGKKMSLKRDDNGNIEGWTKK